MERYQKLKNKILSFYPEAKFQLKDLRDMTEEDAIEIVKIATGDRYKNGFIIYEVEQPPVYKGIKKIQLKEKEEEPDGYLGYVYIDLKTVDIKVTGGTNMDNQEIGICRNPTLITQFLLHKKYAIPFLELDGKNPIEAGLAENINKS